ncbi:phosphatidylglycerophosphatase A family protein [Peptoniphilus stercorisuis]|uniref:Phosphatidylglycerophosphatase A n=1 Tax=Peptoniphilus stercorisuis TaxID=1436965 RepID=A0ABS4KE07_9FIRM|nr:phosphatidylglycerophosphatase A [Peptoniphilus stercorisuis]MBP2025985.1 phosphatidylglycerophosphatase A [Peptoniphilus stercorisuis]
MYKYNNEELYEEAIKSFKDIGVEISDIAEIVYMLQKEYNENITMQDCIENVQAVFKKREVIHAVLTGLAIDQMARERKLPEPIQSIITADEGLYGIDEVLPLGIVNVYGTIGLTNFGYLDKEKIGIIKELDERKCKDKENCDVQTFADDLVAAVAAAAASRIAHSRIGIED